MGGDEQVFHGGLLCLKLDNKNRPPHLRWAMFKVLEFLIQVSFAQRH